LIYEKKGSELFVRITENRWFGKINKVPEFPIGAAFPQRNFG
jgi:hypothetical protein